MAHALSATSSYLDFLGILLKLGPKLSQMMPLLLAAFDLFEQAIAKLGEIGKLLGVPAVKPPAAPVALSVSADELEAEAKVVALAHQHGMHASKLGDGSFLRGAWKFIQDNPWLLQLLAGFLKLPTG